MQLGKTEFICHRPTQTNTDLAKNSHPAAREKKHHLVTAIYHISSECLL
jgi:hypothetical protein